MAVRKVVLDAARLRTILRRGRAGAWVVRRRPDGRLRSVQHLRKKLLEPEKRMRLDERGRHFPSVNTDLDGCLASAGNTGLRSSEAIYPFARRSGAFSRFLPLSQWASSACDLSS